MSTSMNQCKVSNRTFSIEDDVVCRVKGAIEKLDREGWNPGIHGGVISDQDGTAISLKSRSRFNNAMYKVIFPDGSTWTGQLRSYSGRDVGRPVKASCR